MGAFAILYAERSKPKYARIFGNHLLELCFVVGRVCL